ncbi:anti-sigma factor domain-containing protein [Phenylobacterium sp.]|uniref:anti-sigma factor n=1 Tax=Phenylobacterium sp. TaxID=1871053 RepID=UPI00286AFBEF|nr:anti-sigma factor [Phenylobacterium sp.]
MNEGPDLTEAEAFAAEHALGVLSADERRQAEVRAAADPAFASLVDAWRARLTPLAEGIAPKTAPAGLWPRIERALPANDNTGRGAGFWRRATVASLSLAAASLAAAVMLANRPAVRVQPPAPGQLLNASLVSPSGAPVPLFVAAYDPARKALIVTSLVQPGGDPAHVHELWVIPADGKPRALGFIEPGKTKSMPLPQGLLSSLAEGAAIAVSVEPPGGSKRLDAPSGPIAAVGKLAKI